MSENFLETEAYITPTGLYASARNQSILCFDVILQHDWPIEQCHLHIRVFFGGKTKSPCFDLLIHWLTKQIANTYRNHFSRSYENRSIFLNTVQCKFKQLYRNDWTAWLEKKSCPKGCPVQEHVRATCPKDKLEFKFFFFEPWNGDDLEQKRKGLQIISFGQRLQDFDIQVPK